MAGWRLRGYAIEQLLGRGASSEVWRARVNASDDRVALKRLFIDDAEQIRRAHAEAALLTVLDHPHLVRLHAVVPTSDAAVLVLDLADGGSLAELLAARGRLTPGEVITTVAPVAAALAHVHRHGIVHGDVTPANLLFTPGGVSLLADLGVARLTGDESDAESTPAYVDPSVAVGGVPSAATDVFMLGATTLHALTGAPPWSGGSAAELLDCARAAQLSGVPARLAAAGVPAAMAEVVCRALALDPRDRGTAADFALDLRHSGTPVAVELAAGRPRPEVTAGESGLFRQYGQTSPKQRRAPVYAPRHAAPIGAGSPPVAAVPRVPPSGLPPARSAVASALPPTSAVSRPRPVIPRPPPRRFARRHVTMTALVALVLAAAAVLVATRFAPRGTRHRDVAASVDWIAELRAVDAVRARAFATRNAELLDRVYASARLRQSDTDVLTSLVPRGCSLRGAGTRFTAVRVAPSPRRAVITARAAIPVTVLHCTGKPDRRVAAVAPATVRIELARTPAGVRIVSLGPAR